MSTFFEYLLKMSVCCAVVYLFYFLLLKRLTHYAGNRFFLLVSPMLAFFIPLIRIDFFISPQTINSSPFIRSIPTVATHATERLFIAEGGSSSLSFMLIAILGAGVIICSAHLLIQLYSFKKVKAGALLAGATSGIKLYHLNRDIIPFSFGKAIYVNAASHSEDELREIIRHESVHVQQAHTIDVLAAEIFCILNWYNPFAWLIKHAIKQNLEFLADDVVINNGSDRKSYQYLLLKVMGHAPVTIATNLNFSSLKNRIYMMNKTKHSNKHLLKFLLVLPTTALVMLAFRESDAVPLSGISANIHEEIFELHQVTYAIADPRIESIVHKEQDKSFLQAGKPFTITLIKRERDRLRSLLEQNGYDNITDHSISFLIDSSLVNNSFSVQVNIDLQKRAGVTMRNGRSDENVAPTVQHNRNHAMASMNNGLRPSASYRMYRQNVNTIHGGNFSMI